VVGNSGTVGVELSCDVELGFGGKVGVVVGVFVGVLLWVGVAV